MWRRHSCLLCRDSSRHLFADVTQCRKQASARVPTRQAGVPAPHQGTRTLVINPGYARGGVRLILVTHAGGEVRHRGPRVGVADGHANEVHQRAFRPAVEGGWRYRKYVTVVSQSNSHEPSPPIHTVGHQEHSRGECQGVQQRGILRRAERHKQGVIEILLKRHGSGRGIPADDG